MKFKGACQCGQVKYEIDGEALGLAICYCTECQKASTGIATYAMLVPKSSFRLISGKLKQWERDSDMGTRSITNFCPECGVRIFNQNPEMPEMLRVKAGTLENANQLEPDVHVWKSSAPAWVETPENALVYEKQPPLTEIVAAVMARRAGK